MFLALTLFPEAQKKAQAEIDAVIGSDRLPNFSDRDSLPYVEAFAKEVLRWNAVVPLGSCLWHLHIGSPLIPEQLSLIA